VQVARARVFFAMEATIAHAGAHNAADPHVPDVHRVAHARRTVREAAVVDAFGVSSRHESKGGGSKIYVR